ncbi:MAG: hypothetical protein AAF587_20525 [Bacteroidota bacterium]
MKHLHLLSTLLISCSLSLLSVSAQELTQESAIQSLTWRPVGPANMGGRVTDIVGIPGDPSTYYVAGADGGVFKTTNGGTSFEALFTEEDAYSVGALAIAPSDQNVLWLGSGEGDPRNSVGYGRGVYRSLDGGKSWTHLGLDKTERIKRILVHPDNPDVACVCALGREWGPNEERGVFQTTDGGKNWKKILYLNEDTGCSDLAMEESNPRIMYAGMWTFRRKPWRFDDGGKETALYRTRDGGEHWEKIGKGLPEGPMTRIGVAVAQSQPNTVYLITEIKDGGTFFRSDDRGDSWKTVNKDPSVNFRPFYYSDIRVDPTNPNVIYSLSGRLLKSEDGGKKFNIIARSVHGDHQSLWIDPLNSNRLLSGSDGGYQVSYDAGKSWTIINNIELSQFYQMDIDNLDPYNIYGGLQDNGTWVGPSNSLHEAGILKRHWKKIAGGDGYYALPIPGQEHEIYANLQGGVIFHVDTRFGNVRSIHPYPNKIGSAGDAIANHNYRFNWDSPILISPHDPNTVYFGGNVLFKTTTKGDQWEVISPDLTTNDKSKQLTSGGEIYQDNTAAEFHCTILTIAESPKKEGVIWIGTDDGNIQLTQDGGKSWNNLNSQINGLPKFSWIAKIHASKHDAGMALIAVDNHRSDDFRPYAFMTTNFGRSWTNVAEGLPQNDYVKVIRQDPHNPDLLYAGMEHGIYASWDKGKNWTCLNNNLPPVSVRDVRVQARERDLVVATHGRGIWIMDDIRAIEELADGMKEEVHLFPIRQATRWHMYGQLENLGDATYKADNPKIGAYINYFLQEDPKESVLISIEDESGQTIRTMRDSSAKAGVNRLVWDLKHEGATPLDNPITGGWRSGPFRPYAAPGRYIAVLESNGQRQQQSFIMRGDPRIKMSEMEYNLQQQSLLDLREALSQTHSMINQTEQLRDQLIDLKKKIDVAETPIPSGLRNQIEQAIEESDRLRFELRRPPPHMPYRQRPRLRGEIRSLMYSINGATAKPVSQQTGRLSELQSEAAARSQELQQLIDGPVSNINQQLKDLPQVTVGKLNPN